MRTHNRGKRKRRTQAQQIWGSGSARRDLEFAPVVPAQWELLLKQLGVRAGGELEEIRVDTDAGRALRKFAAKHATRCYVPEEVLRELAMAEAVEAGVVTIGGPTRALREAVEAALSV